MKENEKELGGKLNGQDDYLEGKGTQFSFDLEKNLTV